MNRFLLTTALWLVLVPRASAQPAVDSDQLLADIRVLSADSLEGRATGTPGSAKARAYLLEAFESMNLRRFGDSYAQPFTVFRPSDTTSYGGVNVVGYLEGQALPDSFIVVTAHYDHLGIRNGVVYNGADDNASGVAALLALARHFTAHPPRHSIIFAALDAEEIGLQGARHFVEHPPVKAATLVLNVNMDMVSHSETGELYAAGTYHYPALKPGLAAVASEAPVRLLLGHDRPNVSGQSDWTMSSDHAPFHQAGIPFVYFGVEDHEQYHQPSDDADAITVDFFVRAVETIRSALIGLDHTLSPFP